VLTDAATTMRRKLGLLEREAPPRASCNCPAPHPTLESWEAVHGPMDAELWPNRTAGERLAALALVNRGMGPMGLDVAAIDDCCPHGCPGNTNAATDAA
jgi:hypothetical protein